MEYSVPSAATLRLAQRKCATSFLVCRCNSRTHTPNGTATMGNITHKNAEVMPSAGEPTNVPFDQSG